MSPNWNEYTYAQQFDGNLHGSIEPVPMRIETKLGIMTDETARDLKKQDHRWNRAPQYTFGRNEDLPLHPTLLATAHHYFKW